MKILACLMMVFVASSFGSSGESELKEAFDVKPNEKFSFNLPNYFVLGEDDLKLQFSFKYLLSKSYNFYFAYSQLLFWKIYSESKPFEDVNYSPEFFYRTKKESTGILKTLDVGYLHTSNGKDGQESRSLDRYFIRGNFLGHWYEREVGVSLMAFTITNVDATNEDIVDHYGYWDMSVYLTRLVKFRNAQALHLEGRVYAGSKVIDIDQGAYQLALIYDFGPPNFNPSLYLQRFEGYGENLKNYNKKFTEYRLGLLLSL